MAIRHEAIGAGPDRREPQFLDEVQVIYMQQLVLPHYSVLKQAMTEGALDTTALAEARRHHQDLGAELTISTDYEAGPAQLRVESDFGFMVITGDDFRDGYVFGDTASEPLRSVQPGLPFLFDSFTLRPRLSHGGSFSIEVDAQSIAHLAGNVKAIHRGVFDYDKYLNSLATNDIASPAITLTYEPLDQTSFG